MDLLLRCEEAEIANLEEDVRYKGMTGLRVN
jgi:hypothetical protein